MVSQQSVVKPRVAPRAARINGEGVGWFPDVVGAGPVPAQGEGAEESLDTSGEMAGFQLSTEAAGTANTAGLPLSWFGASRPIMAARPRMDRASEAPGTARNRGRR